MPQVPREDFWRLPIWAEDPFPEAVIRRTKEQIWDQIHKPPWVVKTEQLQDNLLLLTMALLCSDADFYMHVLLLGNEGAAKTLAITLVLASAKGHFAASTLFHALPAVQTVRVQLTSATTAAHLRDVANTAQEFARAQHNAGANGSRVVVVMEELGLATGSGNPLTLKLEFIPVWGAAIA